MNMQPNLAVSSQAISRTAGEIVADEVTVHIELETDRLDDDGFDTLFRASFERMTRFAAALVGSRSAGEELAQEAFVRLYVARRRATNPEAYLRRAIVNLATDRSRRRAVAQRFQRAQRSEDVTDEHDTMLALLGALSERQRAAIVLRFYLQCTEAEIAEALGCRPGTVKSLLSRALTTLREVTPR